VRKADCVFSGTATSRERKMSMLKICLVIERLIIVYHEYDAMSMMSPEDCEGVRTPGCASFRHNSPCTVH
jgi:hypothetical protein